MLAVGWPINVVARQRHDGAAGGRWTLFVAGGKIHQEINGKGVTHALMLPIVDGFREGGKVHRDEVVL